MEIKQIWRTNSGLSYQQYAYFIHLKGNKYFCIDVTTTNQEHYKIGQIEDLQFNKIELVENLERKAKSLQNFKNDKIMFDLYKSIKALIEISENKENRDAYTLSCVASEALIEFDLF